MPSLRENSSNICASGGVAAKSGLSRWFWLASFSAMRFSRHLTSLLCISAFAALEVPAQAPPELSADEQSFEAQSGEVEAMGNVLLQQGNVIVRADRMAVVPEEGRARAEGKVSLTRSPLRLLAPELQYDYASETVEARDVRMGRTPVYIEGERVSGTRESLLVENATVHFGEPAFASPRIRAKRIRLEDGETAVFEEATFYVGELPVFYLPEYSQQIEGQSPLRYRSELGYNANLEAFWQNEILYRFRPEYSLGGNLDFSSDRGVLIGPAADYDFTWTNGLSAAGWLSSGYIHDLGSAGTRGDDLLVRPIDADRWFLEWQNFSEVGLSVDLNARISWWSDSFIERDFRDDWYNPNQQPNSFAEAIYAEDEWILSGLARFEATDFQQLGQRLPDFQLSMLPTKMRGTGLQHRGRADYVHLREESPSGAFRTLETDRLYFFYEIDRRFFVEDWLSLRPSAGIMTTAYSQTLAGDDYQRLLGSLGFDAEMTITGKLPYELPLMDINGLRHQIKPVLRYRYLPGADAGNDTILPIDRVPAFDSYLEPLDLAYRRDIDDFGNTNVLRYGIEHTLQTRARAYGSRDLAEWSFHQDLRFDGRGRRPARFGYPSVPEQEFLSDLHMETVLHPSPWLEGRVRKRIDIERLTIDQVSSRLRFTDGDVWYAEFGNDWVGDIPGRAIEQFSVGVGYAINERHRIRADWRYDLEINRLTEQTYAYRARVGQNWDVELGLNFYERFEREGGFQLRLNVRLLPF